MIKIEDGKMRDPLPFFLTSGIDEILVLPEKYKDKISIEDMLQVYLDPHYRPVISIACGWSNKTGHSAECDYRLHEALATLAGWICWKSVSHISSIPRDEDEMLSRNADKALGYIRHRLLRYGAKIP